MRTRHPILLTFSINIKIDILLDGVVRAIRAVLQKSETTGVSFAGTSREGTSVDLCCEALRAL